MVIDDKFPMLEYLHISLHSDTVWHFPLCFKHRNYGTVFWLTSRLLWILTTYSSGPMGLVTLPLVMVDSSAYCRLNELLRQVSLMAHVENLIIGFHFPVSESGPLC